MPAAAEGGFRAAAGAAQLGPGARMSEEHHAAATALLLLEDRAREPIVVTVTGAAGQIAYSLLFSLGKGDVFGHDQPILLRLFDIPMQQERLNGVVMELTDCAFPLVKGVVQTSTPDEAFLNADVAILVGSMPRREGMERADLLEKNGFIFRVQGESIDRVAKKTVKVLVVGNPANTNAYICCKSAPTIADSQFTCLTMLDENRAKAELARQLKVLPSQIKNVIIWGNHSTTQYPDVSHAYVVNPEGHCVSITEAISDQAYLRGRFVQTIQNRGREVIRARKLSSAMSAAKAIGDHLRLWWNGTPEGVFTSMGVMSDGSYGIDAGIFYSQPVIVSDQGQIEIVQSLDISQYSRQRMDATKDELLAECAMASEMVGLF
mmetsp:Transcript_8623/g.25830  ORF Transcript_8623/g.25830 Transcript_8623/m.25830 type:complete len:377 (+) Transcript_8623:114-1244(+)